MPSPLGWMDSMPAKESVLLIEQYTLLRELKCLILN